MKLGQLAGGNQPETNITPISNNLGEDAWTQTSSLPTQVFKLYSTLTDVPYQRLVGAKSYELTDHLGNVRAVISDRKLLSTGSSWTAESTYMPDIISANDYYPFGMEMLGRTFSSPSYRYGFQGHEKDDEIKGSGNHLSFGDFGYDSRIGRRWNIDPVYKPGLSNYLTFGNNPINYIDPSGGDWYRVNGTSKVVWIESDGQDFKGYTYLGEFRYSTNWSTDYNRYGSKYQRYIYWNFLGRGTKGTKLLFDGLAIAGGIVTIATLGAASPIVASLSIISGSFSVAGGITTLTLHLANADELADKVPKGYFDAIIGVTLEYTVDGEKYSDEIEVTRSVLNASESLLSLDLKNVTVDMLEATDVTISAIRVGKDFSDTYNKTRDSGKSDDDGEEISKRKTLQF